MSGWQTYRVIAEPVTAIKIAFDRPGFTFRFHRRGNPQEASPGDWLVEASDGSVYTVAADVFEATYQAEGSPGRYRKHGEVEAREADYVGGVVTREGTTEAVPNNMIVRGPAGDMWAMSRERFDRRYALATPPPA